MSQNSKQYIVAGIGTDVGKTVVSAILAQALEATYWKPVQAGDLDNSDTIKVSNWTDDKVTILAENFRLSHAMSPHAAAEKDGVLILENALSLPEIKGNLIIESAGGVMVPINNEGLLYIDLFVKWKLPVIIVSRHYLGSINHTLLTIEALKSRNIIILGIIFVGDENIHTESIILINTKVKMLGRIPLAEKVDKDFIQSQALLFSLNECIV